MPDKFNQYWHAGALHGEDYRLGLHDNGFTLYLNHYEGFFIGDKAKIGSGRNKADVIVLEIVVEKDGPAVEIKAKIIRIDKPPFQPEFVDFSELS